MSKKLPTPNPPKRLGEARWACAYRWTDATGKRRCATVYGTTRAEAYRLASAEQMKVVMLAKRGLIHDPDEAAPTFAEIATRADVEWWPSHGKPEYHQLQRKRIDDWWIPAVGELPVDAITVGHIAGIISKARKAGRAPATCNRILSAGSMVLQFALRLRLVPANVARQGDGELRQKEPKRRKKVLTAEQLRAFVFACEPKWQPLIGLMAFAGLRHGEAVALRGDDIDLEAGTLTVRRGGHTSDTTKGKADREVPLAPQLRAILADLELRPGRPVSALKDCRAALARAAKRIGLEGVHVHSHLLRHSFATALGQAGVSATVLQRILGHADLSTTQRYIHADPGLGHVDVFGASSADQRREPHRGDPAAEGPEGPEE